MPAISLRPATVEDAPAVAECVNAAYRHYLERMEIPPGPMTEDYDEVIREWGVTVAEDGGNIVGMLVLSITEKGFLLETVAVIPAMQGKGVGKTLLEFAESEALRQGFDSIYLYTHEKMTENQVLYAKVGYVEFDRQTVDGRPRVYMRKLLR